ncbi:MAG TPA: hypothetical protein VLA88_06050, partial [Candidatus Saccharimonadales bacterium]|nr:hypothetical protein [Candidatus Saccharimonadales bacterium]
MATVDDTRRFRDTEEANTRNRAGLLGLQYLDTRGFTEKAELFKDVLGIDEMHRGHIVPLNN